MFYIHGTDANHNIIMCLELLSPHKNKYLKEKVLTQF